MIGKANSPSVFPACVRQSTARFVVIDRATKRHVEHTAGRACALEALRLLGIADATVGVGPAREPIWPSGIVGSITHTDELASAAVARADDVAGLGLDIAPLISSVVARDVRSTIAMTDELAAAVAAGWSDLEALTLVFAAKEAAYKCLYPRVQRFIDFDEARVSLGGDGVLAVDVLGHCLSGRFESFAGGFAVGVTLVV